MTIPYITLAHIVISLVGIASGFGSLSGLLAAKLFQRWVFVFLATTVATSVTGFFFPIHGLTPGIVIGILSLILLAVAIYALYNRQLAGVWRMAFVITLVLSLYLNVLVLIVQLFQKVPALKQIAPQQTEVPFVMTQVVVLATFGMLGVLAVQRFRGSS